MIPNSQRIIHILNLLESTYSNTGTQLVFESPFQLLISTLLAAQSTDLQVNKIMTPFYREFPDAKSIAKLSLEYVETRISSIGLYKTKAKNLLATSQIIAHKYDGKVPDDYDKLILLPGVGRKTANVVLSIAFNKEAIAVDTHVFRVSNRLGLAKAKNVLETEFQLQKRIPKNKWSEAHHWLIWHGRKICRAQKPLCDQCNLNQYCSYFLQYKDEILYWKGK